MNWQDELKKEIEDKTLLDVDELDWNVLISFIKLQLKKQRENCADAYIPQKDIERISGGSLDRKLGIKFCRNNILNAPEPGGSE